MKATVNYEGLNGFRAKAPGGCSTSAFGYLDRRCTQNSGGKPKVFSSISSQWSLK